MRHGDHVRRLEDGLVREVRHILRDLPAAERFRHVLIVHHFGTGLVDDAHAVFHFGKGLCVQHVIGAVGEGDVDADVVAVFIQLFQVLRVDDLAGEPPGRVNRQERVIAQDLHVQVHAHVCHQGAHRAKADDAQGLAQQFRAGKRRFFLLDQFGDFISFPGDGLYPGDTSEDVAGRHDERADLLLLHRLRVGAGSVKYHDPLFRAAVHRDVVVPGAGPRDRQQALREFHLVQVRAAQQQSRGIFDVFADLAAVLFQGFDPGGRDLVHGLYLKHASVQTPLSCSPAHPRPPWAWRYTGRPACLPPPCVPSGSQAPFPRHSG